MRSSKRITLQLIAFLSAFLAVTTGARPSFADDAALTADQIAERMVKGNGFNWEGARTRLRMILTDQNGQRSERSLDVIGRRHDGRLESKVEFLSPSDVAGTRFLTVEKRSGGSEQHIYLPGLKRTRRIVGREREGSFMGSDFTYADLQRSDDKGAKHKRLADDQIDAIATFHLESIPGNAAQGGYGKIETWVRKTDFVPLRTRFYDGSGKLLKTLYVRKIGDLDGRPVVKEAVMKAESGHKTEIVVDSIERKDNIPDSEFTPTALER
jgi:hypothetical protein